MKCLLPMPRRLYSKLLLVSVPLAFVLTLMLFVFFAWHARQTAHQALEQKLDHTLDIQHTILAKPVATQNGQDIQSILNAVVSDPDVARVAVRTPHGQELAAVGTPPTPAQPTIQGTRDILYDKGLGSKVVGSVELTLTTAAHIGAMTQQPMRLHASFTAVLLLTLVIGVAVIYHTLIETPLKPLLTTIEAASQHQQHLEVTWHGNDEIANRNKSDFFAAMSHDIHTPITPITPTLSTLDATSVQQTSLHTVILHENTIGQDPSTLFDRIRNSDLLAGTQFSPLTDSPHLLENDSDPPIDADVSLSTPPHVAALHQQSTLAGPERPAQSISDERVAPTLAQATFTTPLHILLVEDNEINQRVATSMLKKWEHHIDTATTGLEAVEAAQQQRYDLILMDIQMPEMDGIEATQTIRQIDNPSTAVPIVAMTANAMPGDRERFLAAGMNDYITKPIDYAHLLEIIQRHTSASASAATTSDAACPEAANVEPLLGQEVLSCLLSELSHGMVAELIDDYMSHSSELLSKALTATEQDDLETVEYAVHTLKGMSGALGALRLAQTCQSILESCQSKEIHDIDTRLHDLTDETEETKQALDAWRFKS